ncbi:superoxide dismutase [Candidatus Roizmanbacteria bacterium RIFOXYB2_FULL_41_10]|uniref:Superoxide dismutase n=1 Tax=Candidatus Roizmanbacteria bacterium RIFOXYA1_FULL_41_12 TaxID=1802082 RepID=A0A1F7KFB2_9BACT|nr:MAG: superoxide dismutase [Candidatus Roizmanbacteria bacterium RIFOXYA2_FULL_41_8]OGK66539.1 MAG: superoxide dismutase [Candidatus Roizmanbacteria bacterium RIFOXYA1_FULL_41_12]OGK67238.1 MAG: superoxide dismutase [Candidatus Roizmanbacteria bacterium RIFOXYB1_FULL_41_27]OGK69310.1 MAG: superoxide dismutase [Candidatus Roizmanbacteria bacterium RIFOXYB2_FULL_41_10]OGK71768.1 MAG: superoxide dismutase [Candidatus Roizmanbacteria bacterium RIFOXYC1_FULL_41_16]OGK74825.1 MAG: superoxide dismu
MNNHTLPKLNYDYDALEPYIDAKTMEIHHTKHHQAYVDNLNAVLIKFPQYQTVVLEDLLGKLETLEMPEADKTVLRNHGGGHLNHSFFWQILSPQNQKDAALIKRIEQEYRSLGEFRDLFSQTAAKHFGSGWAWLVIKPSGNLEIYSTSNQDSPYLQGDKPLIALDLWEHSYYLKYQNRRLEYIQAFWQVFKLI